MGSSKWHSVPGWEGIYEVSNAGEVRSLDRIVEYSNGRKVTVTGKSLAPWADRSGHLNVRLYSGSSRKARGVHQLVMEAFLGAAPEGYEIRHLNGDPSDNRLSNLAYGTQSENNLDRVAHGTHHNANKSCCPRGHAFVRENLIESGLRAGKRQCKSCSRARARIRRHPELAGEIDRIADEYFAALQGDKNYIAAWFDQVKEQEAA